jgi:hypothetical protein
MRAYIADADGRTAISRVVDGRSMRSATGNSLPTPMIMGSGLSLDNDRTSVFNLGMSSDVAGKGAAAQISTVIGDQPEMAKSTVVVTLRKDRKFKTWVARILGPNTDGKAAKNGRTYEMAMDFIDAHAANDVKAEFHLIDGFYMIAQPAKDGSGRETKRYSIKDGKPSEVDEATVRAAFKMAPKATKTASNVAFTAGATEL